MPDEEKPDELNRETAIRLIKLAALGEVFAGICREMDPPITEAEAQLAESEVVTALLPYRETEDRTILLRVLLGVVEDTVLSLGVSEATLVTDRSLPESFVQFGSDRGTQVAANLLSADMILAELSVELAVFVHAATRANVEKVIAARIAKLADVDAGEAKGPVMAHLELIDLYLRQAKDYLDLGGLDSDIAIIIEAIFMLTKACRKTISWRLKEAQVPIVRQEVGAKVAALKGANADCQAYMLARIGLLLGLSKETRMHLEKIKTEAKRRRW